ncbi:MAG: hypothetical protein QOF64_3147 [Candidatus Binatota bacterium]|nr:hypothetical protein [Candidatus Binatota bacterium]
MLAFYFFYSVVPSSISEAACCGSIGIRLCSRYGERKVRIRFPGREDIIVQENGRKIYMGVTWTKASHGDLEAWIYSKSIQKYEPPYDTEVLSPETRRDLLDLLCEYFEYDSTGYKVIMRSILLLRMTCPACREDQDFEIELPFGGIPEQRCHVGDVIKWDGGRSVEQGGRPPDENVQEEVEVSCPKCRRFFYTVATVKADKLAKVEFNRSKSSFNFRFPEADNPK